MKKTTIITAFLITILVILILSSCATTHCSIADNDSKFMAKQLSSQKLKQAR